MGLTPHDGCPDCLTVTRPFRVLPGCDSLVAFYRCANCDHAWFTSWARDYLEATA